MLTGQISSQALQEVHDQISSAVIRSKSELAPTVISASVPIGGLTTGEPVAANASGILELRGKQLGDTEKWLKTTDLARLDSDGFLFILGRADNAIIRGGFKISPSDVAKTLELHPAIREAAVVGIDDKRLGQVPVAAMTLESGASAPQQSELEDLVREKMTAYSVPSQFRFVDELPLTRSMKVSAADVKALFESEVSS